MKKKATIYEAFISECSQNANRFEDSIKRYLIFHFANENKKKKVEIADKVQKIRMQRDLFERLLGISLEQNVDIMKVLSYPLTSVPMFLCHLDGTICKTDKSNLMKYLDAKVQSQAPTSKNITSF